MGISQNRVRLVPTEIGGGFGGKISLIDEAAAAILAGRSGMPVRLVMRASAAFMATGPRPGLSLALQPRVPGDLRPAGPRPAGRRRTKKRKPCVLWQNSG